MFTYPNALFLSSTNQLHVFVGLFHFHNLGFAWNQHCCCRANGTGVGHGGAIALPKVLDNLEEKPVPSPCITDCHLRFSDIPSALCY